MMTPKLYCAIIHVFKFGFSPREFSQKRSLMSMPPIAESIRNQPTRLVFTGKFQWWAKLSQPPDAASAASGDSPCRRLQASSF
jgi:hypothetical protein